MNELALFAGAGGGLLGGQLLGFTPIAAVEIEAYPREILMQRQKDGLLPYFPIWDDIRTFNGKPWGGLVDIISGGFPCQDISAAGKRAGIKGERSRLWSQMARVAGEVRPRFVFVENSPLLTIWGLEQILRDLAEMGYDARWCVLGACDVGAPHQRDRMWILAYTPESRVDGCPHVGVTLHEPQQRISWWDKDPADVADPRCDNDGQRNNGKLSENPPVRGTSTIHYQSGTTRQNRKRIPKSGLDRVAHRVAHRVDRLKAIGNGQVPAVAAIAFIILSEGLI